MIKRRYNEDLVFSVSAVSITGTAVDLNTMSWTLRLWIDDDNKIVLDKLNDKITSNGEVFASASITDNKIIVKAKLSEYSLGIGDVKADITLNVPNNFIGEGTGQVVKSYICRTDLILV